MSSITPNIPVYTGTDWETHTIVTHSDVEHKRYEQVSLPSLEAALEWFQGSAKRSLTMYYFCPDCESPDGGRLCRQCTIDLGLPMQEGFTLEDIPVSFKK